MASQGDGGTKYVIAMKVRPEDVQVGVEDGQDSAELSSAGPVACTMMRLRSSGSAIGWCVAAAEAAERDSRGRQSTAEMRPVTL